MKIVVTGPTSVQDQGVVNTLISNSGYKITQLIDPMLDGVSFRALIWAYSNKVDILHIPIWNKDLEAWANKVTSEADVMVAIPDKRSKFVKILIETYEASGKPIFLQKVKK